MTRSKAVPARAFYATERIAVSTTSISDFGSNCAEDDSPSRCLAQLNQSRITRAKTPRQLLAEGLPRKDDRRAVITSALGKNERRPWEPYLRLKRVSKERSRPPVIAHERYVIVFHEERWKIRHNGQHSQPSRTQAEAIKAPIDAAHQAGLGGHDAQGVQA
jgi:hypothetical protein